MQTAIQEKGGKLLGPTQGDPDFPCCALERHGPPNGISERATDFLAGPCRGFETTSSASAS